MSLGGAVAASAASAAFFGYGAWRLRSCQSNRSRAAALTGASDFAASGTVRDGDYVWLRGTINYPDGSAMAPKVFAASIERRMSELCEECVGSSCREVDRLVERVESDQPFVVRVWARASKYHVLVHPAGLHAPLMRASRMLLYRDVARLPDADARRKEAAAMAMAARMAGQAKQARTTVKLADCVTELGLMEGERVNVFGCLRAAPRGAEYDFELSAPPADDPRPFVLTTGSVPKAQAHLRAGADGDALAGWASVAAGVGALGLAVWLGRSAGGRPRE